MGKSSEKVAIDRVEALSEAKLLAFRMLEENCTAYGLLIIETGIYRGVKELLEVPSSEPSISASGGGCTPPDFLKDGLCVGFWEKRCSMVVVPSSFLLVLGSQVEPQTDFERSILARHLALRRLVGGQQSA